MGTFLMGSSLGMFCLAGGDIIPHSSLSSFRRCGPARTQRRGVCRNLGYFNPQRCNKPQRFGKSSEGCGRSPVTTDVPGRDLCLCFGDNALESLIIPTKGIFTFFSCIFFFFLSELQSPAVSDSRAVRLGRVCAHKQRGVF